MSIHEKLLEVKQKLQEIAGKVSGDTSTADPAVVTPFRKLCDERDWNPAGAFLFMNSEANAGPVLAFLAYDDDSMIPLFEVVQGVAHYDHNFSDLRKHRRYGGQLVYLDIRNIVAQADEMAEALNLKVRQEDTNEC